MIRATLFLAGVAVLCGFVQAAEPGGAITVDKDKKTVSVACKIAPRKVLDKIYPIEVIATTPTPQGQKAHETVLVYQAKASDLHKALEELGLKAGKPVKASSPEGSKAEGPEVKIWIEIPASDGKLAQRIPLEKSLVDVKTGKPIPTLHWLFTGSAMSKPNPDKDETVYGADVTGTLIGIFPVTDETVIQTTLTMLDEPVLKLETNTKLLPAEGTAVKLVIAPK